jgi:hypothetical protein
MSQSFFAKFSETTRSDLSRKHGVLWEFDDDAIQCRFCVQHFTLFKRKHHCRTCGGIYCSKCCLYAISPSSSSPEIQCKYCYLGYGVSKDLLSSFKSISQYSSLSSSSATVVDRLLLLSSSSHEPHESSLAYALHNNPQIFIRSIQPKLEYGSLYNENFIRPLGETAHPSGYFQITNRTENKCCGVKILTEGCNVYHEIFRPPYMPLPPKESAYALLSNLQILYLIILYDNPFPTAEGMSITYTSRIRDEISPCASPKYFKKFAIYKVAACRERNVLVKYTEEDKVEVRSGQGRRIKYKAVGLLSDFMKSMTSAPAASPPRVSSSQQQLQQQSQEPLVTESMIAAATLDYETNIATEELEVVVVT